MTDLNNQNPSKLTFCVKHKILRIGGRKNRKEIIYQSHVENFRNEYKLKWKVNRNEMNNIIHSHIVGDIFGASYHRNDDMVRLRLCGLPEKDTEIDGFQVEWKLNIKECDLWYRNVSTFQFTKYPQISKDDTIDISTFDMDDFKEYDEFTFCMDINILHEVDMNGRLIDKFEVAKKWNEYIKNEKMLKMNSMLNEQRKESEQKNIDSNSDIIKDRNLWKTYVLKSDSQNSIYSYPTGTEQKYDISPTESDETDTEENRIPLIAEILKNQRKRAFVKEASNSF